MKNIRKAHSDAARALSSFTPILPIYNAPQKGFISYLPRTWIPYAELMRLDKPAGTYYLFFPCLFSTLLAASYTASGPLPVFTPAWCFFSGALIMRGAGSTINDLWDRNLARGPYASSADSSRCSHTFQGFSLQWVSTISRFRNSFAVSAIMPLLWHT